MKASQLSPRTRIVFLAAAGVAAGITGAAQADIIFQDNFESAPEVSTAAPLSDTLDADPVAPIGTWVLKDRAVGGGAQSEQVTNYSPPGAHGGSNYLRLANTGDSQAVANFSAVQTGNVTADFWVNTGQADCRLIMRDSADGAGNLLSWGTGANNGFMTYHDGGGWVVSTVPYTLNTWQHMIATFHIDTASYDINLDGNAVTDLPMAYDAGPLSDFAKLVFAAGSSPPMLIDDVVITNTLVGTPQWNYDGSGDWNVTSHWTSGIPNGVDAIANFLSAASAGRTVYTDVPVTVGTLRFDNVHTYLITGLGSLSMQTSSGAALIDVVQGSHKINLPLSLKSNTALTVATGATLTIADPTDFASGVTATKNGAGTLAFLSTLHAAGPATLKINGGVVNLDAANNDPNLSIVIDPATLNLGANQSLGAMTLALGSNVLRVGRTNAGADVPAKLSASSLTVTGAGAADTVHQTLAGNTLRVTGNLQIDAGSKLVKQGAGVLVVGGLNLDNTAQLDLTDGKMVVDYSGATPLASVVSKLTSGRNNGAWNGSGINSSTASANSLTKGIGYAEQSALGVSSFGGETVDGTSILIRYTALGDANLDGTVSSSDFNLFVGGYGMTGSGLWVKGDFNYDGKVSTLDFNHLAGNFGATVPAPMLGSVVPEPAFGGLLILTGVSTCLRRVRRSR
jgi:hypothetical protein